MHTAHEPGVLGCSFQRITSLWTEIGGHFLDTEFRLLTIPSWFVSILGVMATPTKCHGDSQGI